MKYYHLLLREDSFYQIDLCMMNITWRPQYYSEAAFYMFIEYMAKTDILNEILKLKTIYL